MTFTVKRNSDENRWVDVGVTHGPVTINVHESAGHLRAFWHQLGVVLEEVEAEQRAQDAIDGLHK